MFCTTREKYADPLLTAKSGWLLAGILCQGLGNCVKNARRLTFLRVSFLVQGCLPEINIETNPTYFCRVNDAGCALDLRPACQNLGVTTPKWLSYKWGLTHTLTRISTRHARFLIAWHPSKRDPTNRLRRVQLPLSPLPLGSTLCSAKNVSRPKSYLYKPIPYWYFKEFQFQGHNSRTPGCAKSRQWYSR